MNMVKKFLYHMDDYELNAIFYPTLANLCILLVFGCILNNLGVLTTIRLPNWGFLSIGASFAVVTMKMCMMLSREFSKYLYDKCVDDSRLPTTKHLLYKGYYATEQRNELIQRIRKEFGISLPTKALVNHKLPTRENVLKACSATAQIREKLRRQSNGETIVFKQKNQRFGFLRNFLGGAIISLLIELGCCIYFNADINSNMIWGIFIVHLLLALTSIPLMNKSANEYAKYLFSSYLNSQL